jgi:hypothetical protein
MEIPTGREHDDIVAGLIVAIGDDQYVAIAWDDLTSYLIPAAWAPAVAALVRGEEPAGGGDVQAYAGALVQSTTHALLLEAAGEITRHRFAAQRLEAWVLLR